MLYDNVWLASAIKMVAEGSAEKLKKNNVQVYATGKDKNVIRVDIKITQ